MKHSFFRILIVLMMFTATPTLTTSCSKAGCPAQMSYNSAERSSYNGQKKKPAKQLKKGKDKKSGIFD